MRFGFRSFEVEGGTEAEWGGWGGPFIDDENGEARNASVVIIGCDLDISYFAVLRTLFDLFGDRRSEIADGGANSN